MKDNVKDIIKQWISCFIKILGLVYGILGAASIFLPLADVTQENICIRFFMLFGIIVVVAISALIWVIVIISKKSKMIYSKGTTKIIFEYSDINEIIRDSSIETNDITVIIPINTNLNSNANNTLPSVFERERIYKNTIHRACLDYIYEQTGKELTPEILKDLKIKKDNFDYNGRKGDWFLLKTLNKDSNKKIDFLFAEFFDLEEKDGKPIISKLKKNLYIDILQTVILTICKTERESKIYVPLIGAGAGDVDNPKEIMHFMKSMLRFNKSDLRQEIHVVINEKYRKDAPIYQLTKI